MDRVLRIGKRRSLHLTCPQCHQPMRFDHAVDTLPSGEIEIRSVFADGMRMHFLHACLGVER